MPPEETVQSGGVATLPAPGSEPASSTTTNLPDTFKGTQVPLTPKFSPPKVEKSVKVETPDKAKSVETPAPSPASEGKQTDTPKEEEKGKETTPPPENKGLTPEEQSFKDKFYEAEKRREEAEKKVAEFESELNKGKATQLSNRQQQELARLQNLVAKTHAQYQKAERDARAALDEEGVESEAYAEAYERLTTLGENLEKHTADYQEKEKTYQEQSRQLVAQQHLGHIEKNLKEFELTVEDLKKADPKVDLGNPFSYNRASLKALMSTLEEKIAAKYQARIEAAEAKAKEYREKWDTTSTGSQPDKVGSGASDTPKAWQPGDDPSYWFNRARQAKGIKY